MSPFARGVTAAALVFGTVLLACHRASPVTHESAGAALMRNLVRSRSVDVFVERGPLEEACRKRALVCGTSADSGATSPLGRDRIDYRINPPADRERDTAARILVGTTAMPQIVSLLDRMGVLHGERDGARGFWYQEQVFTDARDVLIATLDDPLRPGLPVTLFCGNDADALTHALGDLTPAWRPWLHAYRAGELALSGPLSLEGRIVAHELGRIAGAGLLAQGYVDLPADVEGVSGRVAQEVTPERTREYLSRAGGARNRIAKFLAVPELPDVFVALHAYPEQLVPKVGHRALSAVNPISRAAHVLCASGVPDDGGAAVADATARIALGTPVHPWLAAGASVDAAGVYLGVDLERWIAWVATRGRGADPTEPDWSADRSPHVRVPLQAALFRFLCETRGEAAVRQIWQGTLELVNDDALKNEFERFLAERARPFAKELQELRGRAVPRPAGRSGALTKGVAMESANARLASSFGSKMFESALDALVPLGANTLALTSYLVDEPDPPEFAGFQNTRAFGSVEGDLGLVCALWQARARGLATWLEPHWLSAPAGSFRGSWVRERESAIADFGARYGAFLEHYGLIAEACGVELLSIGAEIHETTIVVSESRRAKPEAIEWKRRAWDDALAAARGAFSGRLTYVASGAEELEHVELWPKLDAIAYTFDPAIDPRHPGGVFSARTELADRLVRLLAALERVAAAHDRPLLLMGVAFKDEQRPARRTLTGVSTPQFDEPLHESAVFFDVLAGAAKPSRLGGVVLWRFGVEPDDRGDAYVFRGAAVESVVRRAFARL